MPSKRSIPRTCQHPDCGKDFLAFPHDVLIGGAKYCSHKCNAGQVGRRGTLEERFWKKVDKSPGRGPWGDCWTWTASTVKKGYGKLSIATGIWESAHRVGYTIQIGQIPEGMNILHRCDMPPCVRKEHLFYGSLADNNADMLAKGRKYSKLSKKDVCEIRSRIAQGESMQSIANSHNVSQGLISHIKHGRNWVNR